MQPPRATRTTARRNRHRRNIAKDQPPCHLCGGEINYNTTNHLDPDSFTIDHIIPIAKGGADHIDNLAAAHRKCNRAKGDGGTTIKAAIAHITDRTW